jgi:hypothetical protein
MLRPWIVKDHFQKFPDGEMDFDGLDEKIDYCGNGPSKHGRLPAAQLGLQKQATDQLF